MKHYHFQNISSTNDVAKELLNDNYIKYDNSKRDDSKYVLNPNSGIIVTTDYQSHGRGRNNKKWLGEPQGNLYCSIGFRYEKNPEPDKLLLLQVIGCLAAKAALIEVTGEEIFKIKYPNDVYCRDLNGIYKKICGVLVENGFSGSDCTYSIVGIGINVRQKEYNEELTNTAISLGMLGFDVQPSTILNFLEKHFIKFYNLSELLIFDLWKNELNLDSKIFSVANSTDKFIYRKLSRDFRLTLYNIIHNEEIIIDDGNSIRYNLD